MELSQLQYFVETARHNSFTQAAETLHITQPGLSKSISKLEKELGVILFDRNSIPLHLTAEGEAFLSRCRQTLFTLDSGISEVRDFNGIGGEMHIGVSEAIYIRHLIREFLNEHEDVSLHCYLMSHEQMSKTLTSGTTDFVVSRGEISESDIVWQPLYNEQLSILVPPSHPMAGLESVRLKDLADESFIAGDLSLNMHSALYQICYNAGFTPRVRYEGHESDVASLLYDLEHTVMLIYRSTTMGVIADHVGAGMSPALINIPVIGAPSPLPIGIGVHATHYKSAASRLFYDRIVSYYHSLTENE
ncbi:MAG: LysR family transcriptional regulator [Clostridiales Family XIII bacterium]|jgi:DNA-binding transcriptional LysR family regulator|nr:LysR family transcriptional regulator [Clostridiales Family XIII bacterium]